MADQNPSDIFKFVQLNFWCGKMYYPIRRFLEREKPHIMAAQEMLAGPGDSRVNYYTAEMLLEENHFSKMALNNGLHYATLMGLERTEHVGVFVNKPIDIISSQILPLDLLEGADPEKNYRSLLHTVSHLPDGTHINLLTVHTRMIIDGRMGTPVTDYDFRRIADYIAALKGPVILSGDFNLYRGSTPLQYLSDIGLTNLNDVYDITTSRNEISWKPEESVSHVFVSKEIRAMNYHVAPDVLSDHSALVLEFKVTHSTS